MYCSQCGHNNSEGAAFCASCGAPFDEGTRLLDGQSEPQYQQQAQSQDYQYRQQNYQQDYGYQQSGDYRTNDYREYQPYNDYNASRPKPKREIPMLGKGITAMILGIVALNFFCYFFISIPCGIIALCLGISSSKAAKSVGMSNGFSIAGIITGSIGIGIGVIFFFVFVVAIAEGDSYFEYFDYFEEFYSVIRSIGALR